MTVNYSHQMPDLSFTWELSAHSAPRLANWIWWKGRGKTDGRGSKEAVLSKVDDFVTLEKAVV